MSKMLAIQDWEKFKGMFDCCFLSHGGMQAAYNLLLKYELKDVIQFKAKIKAKDLGGGHTTGPHRIEIPKNIYLELGKWVEVFIIKEGK